MSEDNNRITTQTAAVIEGLMDTKHVKLTTEIGEAEPDEICDEGHQLIDMKEEYPEYPIEMRLRWGYLWKNAAYNHHRYTPNQLV